MRPFNRILVTLLIAIGLSACMDAQPRDRSQPAVHTIHNQLTGPFPIDRVIDGDTIRVVMDGMSVSVRLIGIDTPETNHPTLGVEPYGPEASDFAAELLEEGAVHLEFDVERLDDYDRTLAYVYVADADGTWFADVDSRYTQANHAIALAGLAHPLTIQPNSLYADEIAVAVQDARAAGRGMW